MSGNELHFRPGMGSDVGNPPSADQIAKAMRTGRSNNPKALALEVHGRSFGAEQETLTILVVPTALRVTCAETYEHPEFEFEGWVLGQSGKPWVRGALRTNDTDEIQECTIYVLEPGQELGTERTPGIE